MYKYCTIFILIMSDNSGKSGGESGGKSGGKSGGEMKQFVKKKIKPGFKANMKAPMCYFSNFFGGAEFTFMASRTMNNRLAKLYTFLRDVEWDSLSPIYIPRNGKDIFHNFENGYEYFKECRVRLTGKNMYVNDSYRDPYYKNVKDGARVAAGLIAKLMSGCWRKSMHKRLQTVNVMANEILGELQKDEQEIGIGDFSLSNEIENGQIVIIDDDEKLKEYLMMHALNLKYSDAYFRDLLLDDKYDGIYEMKGGRDTAPLWTGEDGLLARCLSNVKQNIISRYPNPPNYRKHI